MVRSLVTSVCASISASSYPSMAMDGVSHLDYNSPIFDLGMKQIIFLTDTFKRLFHLDVDPPKNLFSAVA